MLRTAALLLTLATSPLFAVVSGGGSAVTNGDWWKDGRTNPVSFGILDENGDGKVSVAELAKAQTQLSAAIKETQSSLISAIDADNSGKVSRYEATEGMARWVSLRDRARELTMAIYDRDGDGALSADEAKLLQERVGKVFVKYSTARVDANNDKNFSRPEVDAAMKAIRDGKGALFSLCDTNNDGQMAVQEAKMAFELLMAAACP